MNDTQNELPPVDERLVAPGSRYEIYDGELVHVPHTDEARGPRLSKLMALIEVHTGSEFDVARSMLTRTSKTSDIAADVSVFPCAPDPRTGGRQIEQLAFDVVHTEALGHSGRKAAKLVARGVRRVFAIDVDRACVLEWAGSGTWREFESSSSIEDPALTVPLPIEPLVRGTKVDDAMMRALVLKRNPVIEAARMQSIAELKALGRAGDNREWLAEGLLKVLARYCFSLDPADRARILGEQDRERLDRWISRAASCVSVAEMFAEP